MPIEVADHRGEVGGEIRRIGDDVHGAHQGRRDGPKFVDAPVGADSAAVAGEFAFAEADLPAQFFRGFVLVLAVGQQDRVGQRAGMPAAMARTWASQLPIAVPPLGVRLPTACAAADLVASLAGAGSPSARIDGRGFLGARDDGEQRAVGHLVDRCDGRPLGFVELSRQVSSSTSSSR